jgi:hypothetical protein
VWSGGYLCDPCTSRLTRWVAELPAQWDDLANVILMAGFSGEKINTKTQAKGLELNEFAMSCRERIKASLCGWSRIVCEERGVTGPGNLVYVRPPIGYEGPAAPVWDQGVTPHVVAAWLIPHVDWLSHQPYAVEPWREIRDLRREAWSLANPSGRRRFAVAPCPSEDCGGVIGTLYAWLSASDSLFPSSLICDTCGFELPSVQWVSVLVKGRAA